VTENKWVESNKWKRKEC